jgi:thioredoxin-related protein
MGDRLDKLTNVVVIVTCIVVCGVVVKNYTDRRTPPPLSISGYQRGDQIEKIEGLHTDADRSLLLIVRSTCRYCTDSMPFYRLLREERDKADSRVKLVAVCLESRESCEEYLRKNEFTPDTVVTANPESLKAKATPTLVLVDSGGRVSETWVGRLEGNRQGEVVRVVQSDGS